MKRAESSKILYDGGPRDQNTDSMDHEPAVIGTGDEGGVYLRSDEHRDGLVIYQWHVLTQAEVAALTRGDLRANQE